MLTIKQVLVIESSLLTFMSFADTLGASFARPKIGEVSVSLMLELHLWCKRDDRTATSPE